MGDPRRARGVRGASSFHAATRPGPVDGAAIDAGVGVDRRAGDYRVFGSVLIRRDWSADDPGVASTNVNLVGSLDRAFLRDRFSRASSPSSIPVTRLASCADSSSGTARDNVAIEGTAGAFLGTGDDNLSRFKNRDFVACVSCALRVR